jgi:hypothetical protein
VLPFLLIGPIGGVLVDRLNRSFVMIGSNLLRAVAAFVLTATDVIAFTARNAVTPALVPLEELVAANTVRIAGWQLVNIGGKAMAGFLLFFIGSFGTIGVSIGLYLVSIALLCTMGAAVAPPTRSLRPAVGGKKIAHIITDLADAVVFMVRHPVLRALAFAGTVINAAQYPLMTLMLPILFGTGLEAGPRAYGLFLSATSLGVFITMQVAPRIAKECWRRAPWRALTGIMGSGTGNSGSDRRRLASPYPGWADRVYRGRVGAYGGLRSERSSR